MNRPALHALPGIDPAAAERAAADLLAALGADLSDESLRETPRRTAAADAAMITPEPFQVTTFPNDGAYDELVVVRDIPFHSLCEHHLLPFTGVAHVGSLPAAFPVLPPEPFQVTTFPNDGAYDELVVVRDIPFHSLCEHHLLPFTDV